MNFDDSTHNVKKTLKNQNIKKSSLKSKLTRFVIEVSRNLSVCNWLLAQDTRVIRHVLELSTTFKI